MNIPSLLLNSLEHAKGFDRNAFLQAHEKAESITSIRLNPSKPIAVPEGARPVPWARFGYYLPQRPSFTFDPLFHAGTYYVQEASSMFLEQAIRQHCDLSIPLRVLDLCAAPGGKSTHLHSILSGKSLLVSNEVIRSRVNILLENIVKWGAGNMVVTNNDPRDFERLENFFDVLVVDAPCSGSGLFRREPEAIGEWSESNVELCSQRQKRILADSWACLKNEGLLVYSTCSYSIEEDEMIHDWLQQEMNAEPLAILLDTEWMITDTGRGYRCWPGKVKGEGFYLAAFRKKQGGIQRSLKIRNRTTALNNTEYSIVSEWVETTGKFLFRNGQTVYAWPEENADNMALLLQELRVIVSGFICGELVHGKMLPSHSLAMSPHVLPSVERVELIHERAIKYLQRKELDIPLPAPGWKLASYQEHPLGWMNVLKNRINNYYPQELRIRKDS